jgi:hypothetical protein
MRSPQEPGQGNSVRGNHDCLALIPLDLCQAPGDGNSVRGNHAVNLGISNIFSKPTCARNVA